MNLSSCIRTSDRRLRSWKMVMFFPRISTWEWCKMESSTKKSEREEPRCIFLLCSLCTVLYILSCMIKIKACVKFAMRRRVIACACPLSMRQSAANLTLYSAQISHSPEYHAGYHCLNAWHSRKERKKDTHGWWSKRLQKNIPSQNCCVEATAETGFNQIVTWPLIIFSFI